MPTTDYGLETLPSNPFGIAVSEHGIEPAPVDTFAVGTGTGMPMGKQPANGNEPNQLVNEVHRATLPAQRLFVRRPQNQPTDDDVEIVTFGITLAHGRWVTLGTQITEWAAIISNPQVTTDPDGNLLDEIVVKYDDGVGTPIGNPDPDTGDTGGDRPSSTDISLEFEYARSTP
jgi:hypothetical protein